MFRFKPFSCSAKVSYNKSSPNKIIIQVSSKDGKKTVTASVFPKDIVKEIEDANIRQQDLAKAG